ncbi:ethanolamine ammonia-lyase subunit EutC [Pseudofrankia sp. EUN1h]|uniref:ethanolamine ammonia-lyase subunit EutC n=2 Tax=Pseudofrankia TaxID=2994363 RepID=UPI001F522FE1|nr:ethanolamine ammonia-lyase subunit EutC [Pseudofrankia sp. EUN1h]
MPEPIAVPEPMAVPEPTAMPEPTAGAGPTTSASASASAGGGSAEPPIPPTVTGRPNPGPAAFESRVRAVTPARLFLGRSGTSLRTADQLALRADHAAAQDAVHAALDLETGPLASLVGRFGLFAVGSAAPDRATYLRRPDLGRRLSPEGRAQVARRCPPGADLQVVIGDGLSVAAVDAQVPALLPALLDAAREAEWSVGQVFAVRNARVGLLNEIGELLDPAVVVLLIGERPGLVTAESLSAYLAWRPRASHTDADRNLISNIHTRGVGIPQAVTRILALATAMRATGTSGVLVKEDPSTPAALPTGPR